MQFIQLNDLDDRDRLRRVNFVSALRDYKNAGLAGTIDTNGFFSLVPISNIIHLEGDPVLPGYIKHQSKATQYTTALCGGGSSYQREIS